MPKTTTAEAYKKGSRKIVTLASGFMFEIRRLPPKLLPHIFAFGAVARDKNPGSPEVSESFTKALEVILPACIVKPRVVLENPKPDELEVDDISPDDAIELFRHIMDLSGMTPRELEAAKKS